MTQEVTPITLLPALTRFTKGPVHNGNFLLLGSSGCGKSVYGMQLASNAVAQSYPLIFLTTERRPSDVVQYAGSFGWKDLHGFRLADCYSCLAGLEPEGELSLATDAVLSDVTNLIEKARADFSFRAIVLDSLTPIMAGMTPETVHKFIHVLTGKMKKMGALSLVTLQSEVLDNPIVSYIKSAFDGILEMKIDENPQGSTRLIRLQALRGAPHTSSWLDFTIGSQGMEFGGVFERLR
ncbi:MAG: RAD55 family ATPase [Candidatus Bathyarchaeia archaeon]